MKKSLLAILLATPAFACQEAPPQTTPFTSLERGWSSNYHKRDNLVFTNQKTWETHYKTVHGEKVPAVNFNKETVLAVYMGMKSNPGYSVEIKEVRTFPPSLDVLVENHYPETGKIYPEVIASPYHLVKVEKTTKSVVWTYIPADSEGTTVCPKPPAEK